MRSSVGSLPTGEHTNEQMARDGAVLVLEIIFCAGSTELTPASWLLFSVPPHRDDYALNILDAPARPAECVAADPENPLCQIEGEYTVELNDFATKTPYANMAQKCPSKPPKYDKPSDC